MIPNQWYPVLESARLGRRPVGLERLGKPWVAFRDGQQRAVLLPGNCPHRGAALRMGRVVKGELQCPWHGFRFDQSGQCTAMPCEGDEAIIPKAMHLDAPPVAERHGLIWVSLGEPEVDVPAYAEWDDPSYRHVLGGPYPIRAAGPRAIENFLDVTHFPFVHEGILGSRDHTEVGDYNVEVGSDGITASEIHTWTPDPDGSGQAKTAKWLYRVLRPLTAYIQLGDPDGGPDHYSMFFAVTPVDERECIGWMWNSMNYNHELSDEDFLAYIDEIVLQDIPIVESQRPELLPLDLQTELHVKPDATAIAYRRWLKELGMTVGVA